MSQAHLWRAVILALRVLESINDPESLSRFDFYALQYRSELERAFGERKEIGSFEEVLGYVKAQIDAFLSPSEEELKKDKAVNEYVEKYIKPLADALESDALKPASEKKPRARRKAPRRTPASA
jgi:hypothetical protein